MAEQVQVEVTEAYMDWYLDLAEVLGRVGRPSGDRPQPAAVMGPCHLFLVAFR